MNRNKCRQTRQEIDQSELGERLGAMAEAHVATCHECAQFRAERNSLRELVGSLAPVAAPSDFDVRLRARLARDRESGARQPYIFRTLMSTPGIAVAAVLVMLVGSIVLFNQRRGGENSNSASTAPANLPSQTPERMLNSPNGAATTASVENPPDGPIAPAKEQTAAARSNKPVLASRTSGSSDFAISRAPSIRLTPDRAGEVSLTAPVNPMVVSVRDEHGATRRILLPPVSFGSQKLTDNRIPVSMNNTRDW